MKRVKLEVEGLTQNSSQSSSFVLLLREEKKHKYRIPIVIGVSEAQSIVLAIENIIPSRPLTHNLFNSFADAFHYTVQEVEIIDFIEGVFFSEIFCTDGIREIKIDARPSDAISIALRFGASIYIKSSVFKKVRIETEIDDKKDKKEEDSFLETLKNASLERLEMMLRDSLSEEDYEKAAIIRDEITKRN